MSAWEQREISRAGRVCVCLLSRGLIKPTWALFVFPAGNGNGERSSADESRAGTGIGDFE